jgi:LPXTG-site transpeptidase (sortase) family protein
MRVSWRWWFVTASCVMLLVVAEVAIVMPRQVESHPMEAPAAPAQHPANTAAVPVRLKVPAAGVDAPVIAVGLASNGDMQAPSGAHDTAWYKLGPYPGNAGTAVIAGHHGRWQNGDGSVFDSLHDLKAGAKLYTLDQKGHTSSFTVRGSRLFGRDDDARAVFTSPDTKAHLNLITCQGVWNTEAKTYTDRLVVFSDLD